MLDIGGTNDLMFVNGGCPVTRSKTEVVQQRLLIRLRTFYGEWFLNDTYGVPYFERILGHKVTKDSVDAIFQDQIHQEAGVAGIVEFNSQFNSAGRQYSCQFRVRVDNGEISELITI